MPDQFAAMPDERQPRPPTLLDALALLVVFTVRKVAPFLAILGSALFAGILACFTQWPAVQAFVDDSSLGTFGTAVTAAHEAVEVQSA